MDWEWLRFGHDVSRVETRQMSEPQPHHVSLVYKMESPERDLGSDQTRLRQLNFAVQPGIDTIRFDLHQSLNEAGFLIECGHLLVHPWSTRCNPVPCPG